MRLLDPRRAWWRVYARRARCALVAGGVSEIAATIWNTNRRRNSMRVTKGRRCRELE